MKRLFKRRESRIGVEMDANGKVLSKHDETKEHKKERSAH
jgi:hypothetical protein